MRSSRAGSTADLRVATAMNQHPIHSEDMREIVESFVVETREILDRLDRDLLQLEERPGDAALVNEIFRAVHTVKGTSGFLSLEQLNQLTHQFEEVLNLIRRGEIDVRPDVIDVLFEAFDRMKELLQQVVDEAVHPVDLADVLARLAAIASIRPPKSPGSTRSAEPDGAPASPPQPAAPARTDSHTIRVDVDRLDDLLNLVGELVLGRNRLAQLLDGTNVFDERLRRELGETNEQIALATTELQAAVMRTRMVPIRRVFGRFPRIVRDLAKEAGKAIRLEVEGNDTELDRSLIEEIADPLVHLIRNAADHGVEPADARRAQGKPEVGTIRLSAAHEGNHVAIRVQDDGAGISPDVVARRAVEKGLVAEREAADLSREDALQLIFRPGFSTAAAVGKVSGRGVGMDVVKTNITRLNGMVEIDSQAGIGTTFTLRLPLTLAIIQSLLARVGSETFAIPLHSVIEVVHLGRHPLTTINGREVVRLRDRIVPLVPTADVLNVSGRTGSILPTQNAVIVAIANDRIGFVVDDLIGQKEIVIKPLGGVLRKVQGIAGSTILGDGRVIMILDMGELLALHTERVKVGMDRRTEAA